MSDNMGLIIWWLSQDETEIVHAAIEADTLHLPAYIEEMINNRYGRAGRGRLWLSHPDLDFPGVLEWTDGQVFADAANSRGGLVMSERDAVAIRYLPGFVTDTALQPWKD